MSIVPPSDGRADQFDLTPAFLRDSSELKRLARGLLSDAASADDVVQEVWLASLERTREQLNSPKDWLRAVTRTLSRQEVRGRGRRSRREEQRARPEALESTDALVERSSSVRHLRNAVEALGEPLSSAIRLHYLESLSVAEVAEKLGRPFETVKSQLSRGRDELRNSLDKEFGDRRGWIFSLITAFEWAKEDLPSELLRAGSVTSSLKSFAWMLLLLVSGTALYVSTRPGIEDSGEEVAALEDDPIAESQLVDGTETRAPSEETSDPVARTPVEDVTPAAPEKEPYARLEIELVGLDGRPVNDGWILLTSPTLQYAQRFPEKAVNGKFRIAIEEEHVSNSPLESVTSPVVMLLAGAPEFAGSDVHHVPVRAGATIPVRMITGLPPRAIRGRVLDANRAPIEGARISINSTGGDTDARTPEGIVLEKISRWRMSDANGDFESLHHQPGIFDVTVTAAGFASANQTVDRRELADRPLEFVMQPAARLTGVVTREDGSPAAGARVSIDMSTAGGVFDTKLRTAYADADGRFDFGSTEAMGMRSVVATLEAESVRVDVLFVAGEAQELALNLSSSNSMRVRVIDEEREPLVGVRIYGRKVGKSQWKASVSTDDEGIGLFTGCPDAPMLALVMDPENVYRSFPIAILEAPGPGPETHELIVKRPPTGPTTLTGRLVSHDGAPVSASMKLSEPVLYIVDSRANDPTSGEFRFTGLQPNNYLLYAALPSGERWNIMPVEITGQGELDVGTIEVPEPGKLSIDWQWSVEDIGETGRWALAKRSVALPGVPGAYREVFRRGHGDPEEEWVLAPGLYLFAVRQPNGTWHERRTYIRSGVETKIESGPESRAALDVEILSTSTEPAEVALSIYRVDSLAEAPESFEELKTYASHGELVFETTRSASALRPAWFTTLLTLGEYVVLASGPNGQAGSGYAVTRLASFHQLLLTLK